MGVWQPHHAGQYNHHAIGLQPNCTMLGYHALHELKSYSSPGVSMTPHRGTMQYHTHPYSSPTATQHPACDMVTSRITTGEEARMSNVNMQGRHTQHPSAKQVYPNVNYQSSPKLLHAMVPKSNDTVQEYVYCNSCFHKSHLVVGL